MVDISGDWFLERVGHHGIGQELKDLAKWLGVNEDQLLRDDEEEEYWAEFPEHGLCLALEKLTDLEDEELVLPEDAWCLVRLILYGPDAGPEDGCWKGAWPLSIRSQAFTFEDAVSLLGDDNTADDYGTPAEKEERDVTFFIEGRDGLERAVGLTWGPSLDRLEQLLAISMMPSEPFPKGPA